MKALWWILGLAAAGTGAYVLNNKYKWVNLSGDLCTKDLPEPFKTQVLEAVKDEDKDKLLSYATQADTNGWPCAASEMRAVASSIKPKLVAISPVNTINQPSPFFRANTTAFQSAVQNVKAPTIVESKPVTMASLAKS